MAFDEGLAQRVRERVLADGAATEKRMFGGLAFLLNGNLAVGVSRDELLVRLSPEDGEAALARPGVRVFDMTGRPMRGWILVAADVLTEDEALNEWIDEGCAFAAGLPPK
jgi:TfoX/Sxy family transcriptional regulator of competence genes